MPDSSVGQNETSPGEAYDAACRENELAAMAEAGQKLAVQWGHEPWSDSWARLVAETLDRAARNANHWRCADCACLNRVVDSSCYLCGAGRPEDDERCPACGTAKDEGDHYECIVGESRGPIFEAFLGGFEAVYDGDISAAPVRASFEEWLRR